MLPHAKGASQGGPTAARDMPSDLLLGPKRHWTVQQNLLMNRQFHESMIRKAQSHIGLQLDKHRRRMAEARKLFDQSTAKKISMAQKQRAISEENKRLLKRLLSVEMQQTEITKTNDNSCAEKMLFRMRRKARKKAVSAARQWKLDRINRENQLMLQRIDNARGSLDSKKWKNDFNRHKKRSKIMSKMRHRRKPDRQHRRKRDAPPISMHSVSLPELRQHPGSHLSATPVVASRHRRGDSDSTSRIGEPVSTSNAMHLDLHENFTRQRLHEALAPLSLEELRAKLEQYAAHVAPDMSTESFREMTRDLPRKVMAKTLVEVLSKAPRGSSGIVERILNTEQLFVSRGPEIGSMGSSLPGVGVDAGSEQQSKSRRRRRRRRKKKRKSN